MKNKKLIIGGVAILILYFLYKKKSKQTVVAQKSNEYTKSYSQTADLAQRLNRKTYYKTKDGKVLQCADGYTGGTKESPVPFNCIKKTT